MSPASGALVTGSSAEIVTLSGSTWLASPGAASWIVAVLHRASGAPFTAGPGTTGTYAQLKYDLATVLSWGTSGSTPVRIEGRFLDGRYFSGDTAITIP